MNRRVSKALRKMASLMAKDHRGQQVSGTTVYWPKGSARGLYQNHKKQYTRNGVVKI